MTTDTEALREQFEAWARKNELEAERHKYADDQYDDPFASTAWRAYQAGHAAAKAETADVGEPVAFAHFAENGNIRLWAPERPRDLDGNIAQPLYTADQLAAAVAAERERCLRIVESVDNYSNPMTASDCAAAIRAGAKERGE